MYYMLYRANKLQPPIELFQKAEDEDEEDDDGEYCYAGSQERITAEG